MYVPKGGNRTQDSCFSHTSSPGTNSGLRHSAGWVTVRILLRGASLSCVSSCHWASPVSKCSTSSGSLSVSKAVQKWILEGGTQLKRWLLTCYKESWVKKTDVFSIRSSSGTNQDDCWAQPIYTSRGLVHRFCCTCVCWWTIKSVENRTGPQQPCPCPSDSHWHTRQHSSSSGTSDTAGTMSL